MGSIRSFATLLVSLWVTVHATAASATRARLILPVSEVRPGDQFLAGIELTMNPGWHTYWRNGGDSGKPTTIEWTLPAGFTAGEIRWPAPERLFDTDLITFIYHATATLLVPISVGPDAVEGEHTLSARVEWLECAQLCVGGRGTVSAHLKVARETRASPEAGAIREAEARIPTSVAPGEATAAWDGPASGEERPMTIRWRTAEGSGTPDFYPYNGEGYEILPATDRLPTVDGWITLRKKVRKSDGDWPGRIGGLLVMRDARNLPALAREALLPVADHASSASPGSAAGSPASPPAVTPSVAVRPLSLAGAIGLGVLGGLILNIMPCVLPVIALKILGFVRQSGNRPAEIRKLGLTYALGVWVSFMVLAGVVIAVKKTAGIAGWGMQFGNPVFLVAMTTLVLLVSLSLFGVFEINFSGRALDSAGELASREGSAGAFFNGALAVALATPCTAPFLAPALGYAFAADSTAIVTVFSAVALGLAGPYVLLSFQPAWLKALPKPGAWMERFKVAMGFPMLATALWLYTLAADRFGVEGPLWLGIFLVGMSLAAWVWGEFAQRGRRHQSLAMGVSIAFAALFYAVALERELNWRQPPDSPPQAAEATTNGTTARSRDQIAWQPWSPNAITAARQNGQPVLVDFTADWCLTCRLNERSSINIPSVRAKLAAINAVPLRGDHTRFPPAIAMELQRFQRAGVPLVVVYPRDPAKKPIVLPEILTPSLVLEALDQATL